MSEKGPKPSKRLLDPMVRLSEILFGLIMVLTITSSISVAQGGRQEVRTMLVGAVGCNLAWGIIDGVFYLLGVITQRGHGLIAFRALRRAKDAAEAHRIIADELPPLLAAVISPIEFEVMRGKLNEMPDPPVPVTISRSDWLAALGVCLLVFLSTFPVVVPFLFITGARLALRVSNGVAIVMLFLTGYALGRYSGRPAWKWGLWMVLLGAALAGLAGVMGG